MKARGIVTILKRRLKAGSVDSMQLVGDVSDAITVIVDDMIDTGYAHLFCVLFLLFSFLFFLVVVFTFLFSGFFLALLLSRLFLFSPFEFCF